MEELAVKTTTKKQYWTWNKAAKYLNGRDSPNPERAAASNNISVCLWFILVPVTLHLFREFLISLPFSQSLHT